VGDTDQRRSKNITDPSGNELFAKVAPESIKRYVAIEEKFGTRKLELLYELLDDLIKTLDENES